ncbi:hypothetical protein [Planctomycetes bacterium Pan216]
MTNTPLKVIESFEENWKVAHKEVTKVWKLEDFLFEGVYIFKMVNDFDMYYRERVITGKEEFDPGMIDGYKHVIGRWLQIANHLENLVLQFERSGFEVSRAEEFRSTMREAEGILTPDDDFFSGGKLDAIKEVAIEEYKRGEFTEGLID